MQVGGFSCIYFAVFYCSCMASGDLVDKINRLLECPGWKALGELAIVQEDKSTCGVDGLLSAAKDGQRIVTAGNVNLKIGHTCQFLGCKYTRTLMTYCDYAMGIAYQFVFMSTGSDQRNCLEKLRQCAKDGVRLVQRMESALWDLRRLFSNKPVQENDFNKILVSLAGHFLAKVLDERQWKNDSLEINQSRIRAIFNYLDKTLKDRLLPFFKKYCSPVSMVSAATVYKFDWANNYICPVTGAQTRRKTAMSYIATNVRQMVNRFVTDFESMGFEYDDPTDSSGTLQTVQSPVDALDELLAHAGWVRQDALSIVRKGQQYNRQQVLSADTDKDFNNKLRRAHQLLSCQMAKFLINCFVSHADIGNHCLKMNDAQNVIECQQLIAETLRDIDVVVMLMRGAFIYFYQLSPLTRLNKVVSDILDQFAGTVEMAMLERPAYARKRALAVLPALTTHTMDMQAVSSTAKQRLGRYFQEFCCSTNYLETINYLEDDTTIDVRLARVTTIIADKLRKRIQDFMKHDYPSLGFVYDPFSNTASIIKKNKNKYDRTLKTPK